MRIAIGSDHAGFEMKTAPARLVREHSKDMHVLVLGARLIGPALAQELVNTYIGAKFTNEERHLRRLNKVKALAVRFGT